MNLHIIDLGIIFLYFVTIIVIGFVLKKKASKNLDSYFLGGKTLPFYMLGLSNASGMFDITGTMLMVYWAFAYGFKSLWIPWLWPVFNQIFLMIYLSVWLRRSNVLTGAEWIKTRFGTGKGAIMSHTIVVIFAVLSVVGFLSYGFIGVGKFIEVFFPWSSVAGYIPFDVRPEFVPHFYGIIVCAIATVYVIMGGMLSIVWTDVIQFLIMTVAGVIIAVLAMNMVSPEMIQSFVPSGWETPFFGWKLDLDWSEKMPQLTERMAQDPYSLISIFVMMALFKGLFMSMAGPAPNYDMQKILACKSPKEAALMSGSVPVILLIPRYLMIMGFALLAIYFFQYDGGLATMGGHVIDFENILPHLITKYVPVGLIGLLLAGLLAAFMSTFASTVNAAPAYIVNDIYVKYINPNATPKKQVRASYLVSFLVVLVSIVIGFFLKDINEIFQWIVGALFGGYIASNVLKWHWWRFNGHGYFWGMAAGMFAALVMKFTVPDNQILYYFPVLLAISLIGCIVGTFSAPATDKQTLMDFYIRVRPWGFWKPIHEQVVERYPQVKANTHFKRDAFNVFIGIIWQCCLTLVPMYLVVRFQLGFLATAVVLLVTTLILRKTWYKPLCKDEKEYDALLKEIGYDK